MRNLPCSLNRDWTEFVVRLLLHQVFERVICLLSNRFRRNAMDTMVLGNVYCLVSLAALGKNSLQTLLRLCLRYICSTIVFDWEVCTRSHFHGLFLRNFFNWHRCHFNLKVIVRVCLKARVVIQSCRGLLIKEFWRVLAALDRLFSVHSSSCDALLALDYAERQSAHHHLFKLFVSAKSSSEASIELVLSLLLYCSLFQN